MPDRSAPEPAASDHSGSDRTAPEIDGLGERSITEFEGGDLTRQGVRAVGGKLEMSARVRAFGAIMVIDASGPASEFERRPLRPDLPTIDLIFIQQGGFDYFDGGAWAHTTGPLVVAPSGLPHRARCTGPWRFIVARVPRQALLPYVPMLSDEVAIYEDLTVSERGMEAFLRGLVANEDGVSQGESNSIDRMVLEMAGTLVRNRQGDQQATGSPRAIVRDRALAEIVKRSADPRLDPNVIAASLGVSLRHLQSVFADAGSSVAGEIRRERARVARSALQDPRFDEHSIEQVAVHSGFGSSASMRRVLEEVYRLSPRELRKRRSAPSETPAPAPA